MALVDGLDTHQDVDGEQGSGLYPLNWACEGSSEIVNQLLKSFNANETAEKVWKYCQGELDRVLNGQ